MTQQQIINLLKDYLQDRREQLTHETPTTYNYSYVAGEVAALRHALKKIEEATK